MPRERGRRKLDLLFYLPEDPIFRLMEGRKRRVFRNRRIWGRQNSRGKKKRKKKKTTRIFI